MTGIKTAFKNKVFRLAIMVYFCFMAIAFSVNAQTIIVVSTVSPFKNISIHQAKKIWLGEKKRLNGVPMIALDQKEGKTQHEFYQKILGKTPQEIDVYWKKMTFTGKAFAPTKLSNDQQIKEWLSLNPLAIGYIDVKSQDDSVRVLLEIN